MISCENVERTEKRYYERDGVGLIQGADKSLARPSPRCILFDGENISFDASLVIYINSTNIQILFIVPTNAR